ncbi:MAG: 23S rRNA (pseudouridine(1915)-N(3))-methyltransferase RlmH [Pseudomonadota bacterium]
MRINIIAVGKRMPDWIDKAFNEYNKRLPNQIELILTEITPANRNRKNSVEQYQREEEKRILNRLDIDSFCILLDEQGKPLNSIDLANKLNSWIDDQQPVSFLIGGPDGVSKKIKQHVQETWSLSALTIPHALVRVLLIEQIYRGWTIINKHPYHRE